MYKEEWQEKKQPNKHAKQNNNKKKTVKQRIDVTINII